MTPFFFGEYIQKNQKQAKHLHFTGKKRGLWNKWTHGREKEQTMRQENVNGVRFAIIWLSTCATTTTDVLNVDDDCDNVDDDEHDDDDNDNYSLVRASFENFNFW